ncbi:hypothetical protein [Magnetococcus sp. PR-3]|uniref:hypothetical protein n=1 Tax=Magnetococcus sp. PR-3 TaxID=3120355 RepID=UPI002FCDE6B0
MSKLGKMVADHAVDAPRKIIQFRLIISMLMLISAGAGYTLCHALTPTSAQIIAAARRPITTTQRETLSVLVKAAATAQGQHVQAAWAAVKQLTGRYRARDFDQFDYQRSHAYLIQLARR